jgi:hypothetical protein
MQIKVLDVRQDRMMIASTTVHLWVKPHLHTPASMYVLPMRTVVMMPDPPVAVLNRTPSPSSVMTGGLISGF